MSGTDSPPAVVSGPPATPGQRAYEASVAVMATDLEHPPWRWDQLPFRHRESWEAAAQAAIAAAPEPDEYEPGSVVIGPGEQVIADFPVADADGLAQARRELAEARAESEGYGMRLDRLRVTMDRYRKALEAIAECRAGMPYPDAARQALGGDHA